MKKQSRLFYCHFVLLLLVLMLAGCTGGTNEESKTDASEGDSAVVSKSTTESDDSKTDDSNDSSLESTKNEKSNHTSGDNTLSEYSSEQIEYARVWLQLGANQEIDELNVRHIQAGEPINPYDNTSASYPEEVIQLAGSRLVDGSVTYSGNGDGTINIYNVPLRWDGSYPASENFYTNIIKNTKRVYVAKGDDIEIKELIEMLNVHD